MNTNTIDGAATLISEAPIEGSFPSMLSAEASAGIVSVAKTAAENLMLRNPLAATLVGGAIIGVGATLLAIKLGPKAVRLARFGARRAATWVSDQMAQKKTADLPIQPVPPPPAPEPA